MVGDGYTAFETASHQMTRINNASGQLPEAIKRVVMIIIQSQSPIEVEYLLPNALDSVSELTNICMCVFSYIPCAPDGQNGMVAETASQRRVAVVRESVC